MAGKHLDPRLDHLHPGTDRRRQGTGRIAPSKSGDATFASSLPPLQFSQLMSEPLLDATGVAKSYGAVAALRNASLAVRAGEVHALMGANGAGKSTLVKILTGA